MSEANKMVKNNVIVNISCSSGLPGKYPIRMTKSIAEPMFIKLIIEDAEALSSIAADA